MQYEELEGTKEVIAFRISKKNRQHNGQKVKVQKNKQRSTKLTHKIKDRATRTPLKTGGKLRRSGSVSSFWSTSDIRRVNLVTNPVISRDWEKDRGVFTTSGTYPWSFVTQIVNNGRVLSTFFLFFVPFEVAVLSVRRFIASGYLLDIFKMFLKSVGGVKSFKRYNYSVISWWLVLLDEGIWSRCACRNSPTCRIF
jgi:hypothetical protein